MAKAKTPAHPFSYDFNYRFKFTGCPLIFKYTAVSAADENSDHFISNVIEI
jgi:hypothetical protein